MRRGLLSGHLREEPSKQKDSRCQGPGSRARSEKQAARCGWGTGDGERIRTGGHGYGGHMAPSGSGPPITQGLS